MKGVGAEASTIFSSPFFCLATPPYYYLKYERRIEEQQKEDLQEQYLGSMFDNYLTLSKYTPPSKDIKQNNR